MAGFWDSKPPAGTGIDWRHPLAIGLSACLPLNEGDGRPLDLVTGQQTEAYASGASGLFWAAGPNGMVLLHNAPGGGSDSSAALTLPLACTPKTQAFTYWLRLYRPLVNAQSVPIRSADPGASGGIEIRIPGDNSILLLRAQQAAFTASPANVLPSVGWWDVAITHATDNVYRYYVNGKDVGGGVTTGVFDGNKRFNLGGSGATENVEQRARTSQLLVYNRTLAPEEIAALTDDPHQIYRAPFWFALRYTTPVPVEMRARAIITPATSRGAQAAIRLSVTPRVSLLATRAAASATTRLVRFRAAAIGARGEQNAIAPVVRFRAAILGVRGFLGSARVRATASTLLTAHVTLTQSAVPVADVGVGGWTNELGATSNLYASLDEAVASDAEYVQSSLSPLVVDEAKIRFGPLGPPSTATDHTVRYRYQKSAAAGDNLTLVVRLYRADGVTVVAEQTHTNIGAVTDATLALTFSEANSIPIDDYSTGLVLGLRAGVTVAETPGVTDSFNRADDAASLGSADSGQVWEPLVGTWGISSNQARILASGAPYNYAVVESGLSDAIIQVTLDSSAAATAIFGLAFRMQSAGNGLILRARPSVSQLALYRLDAGAATFIQGVTYSAPPACVVRVVCVGEAIQCYVDDVLYIDEPALTDYQTETKHGLLSLNASAATWDDFSVVVP